MVRWRSSSTHPVPGRGGGAAAERSWSRPLQRLAQLQGQGQDQEIEEADDGFVLQGKRHELEGPALWLTRVAIEYSKDKTEEELTMTPEQVEEKIIQLIHREPFIPFVVEMTDGQLLTVPHPRLAINGGGAGFIGPDGGLVDFEFKTVRSIRFVGTEAVA